jgi:hypothetical protein
MMLPRSAYASIEETLVRAFFCSPARVCVFMVASLGGCLPSSAEENSTTITELEQLPQVRPDFPTPTDPNLLFYIQHSTSPNTVVYTAHIDESGTFDREQPIDVYWRRFTSGGTRTPLTFLERVFAYGVKVHSQSSENNTITANIVSYPQRVIKIDFDDQAKPRATIEMGSHHAKLVYVYLDVDESKFLPSIRHVDVFGRDVESGRVLHEVIEPSSATN